MNDTPSNRNDHEDEHEIKKIKLDHEEDGYLSEFANDKIELVNGKNPAQLDLEKTNIARAGMRRHKGQDQQIAKRFIIRSIIREIEAAKDTCARAGCPLLVHTYNGEFISDRFRAIGGSPRCFKLMVRHLDVLDYVERYYKARGYKHVSVLCGPEPYSIYISINWSY